MPWHRLQPVCLCVVALGARPSPRLAFSGAPCSSCERGAFRFVILAVIPTSHCEEESVSAFAFVSVECAPDRIEGLRPFPPIRRTSQSRGWPFRVPDARFVSVGLFLFGVRRLDAALPFCLASRRGAACCARFAPNSAIILDEPSDRTAGSQKLMYNPNITMYNQVIATSPVAL